MRNVIFKPIAFCLLFISMLMIPATVSAQDFNDDVNDEPAAPISNYIYAGLFAGIIIGYRLLKKSDILA